MIKVNAGEWPAIRHVLITLGKKRGYGESLGVTGADGENLKVEIDVKDTLIARIAAIVARTSTDSDTQ